MFAADPPAVVQPAPSQNEPDVIEIVATRSDQALKIDRRTYRVQQTPHSAQKDAVQLLRGLPAVSVSPDDQILLLGAGNAKIYVDGRPYTGDARQYLRTLHGTDVERIEVITNPSAQYSAEGTAGIVNLVLRKKADNGVSGNLSAEAASLGGAAADGTVKYKRGRFTYEFAGGGNVGVQVRSTYHKLRSVEPAPGSPATINSEDGDGAYRGTDGHLSSKIGYDVDSRTTVSAKLGGGGGHDTYDAKADFRGLTPDFAAVSERQQLDSVATFLTGDLSIDHKGKEGETLNAAAQFYGNPSVRDLTSAQFSDGTSFLVDQRKKTFVGHTQVDWTRTMRKDQILSVGGSWDIDYAHQRYRFIAGGNDDSLGPSTTDEYAARTNTFAAYVTFQQPLGKLIIVPGFRVEQSRRRITSPGLPDVRIDRANVFPTLHLKYPLGKGWDLTASYSKRIDPAPLQYLRPYRSVEDVVTIFQGNPRLKDQSADAYEVDLHYRAGKVDAGLIVYNRETSALWSKSYFTDAGGASIYTYINAGHSRDSGAEFDLGTPITRQFKTNVSVNLFNQRVPVDILAGSGSESMFRYTTNGTLQWTGPDRGKVPGDVAQIEWTYYGPARNFQIQELAWHQASLSYTHSFSRTLSLSSTLRYRGPTRHRLFAPLVQEDYSEQRATEFKVKLLKTLGTPR